ncbi:hypothetical protein A0J61_07597, partial [Choanephora cucurbitarum]
MSCGIDLTTKLSLSNKTVAHIVVHQLPGKSNVFYIPKNELERCLLSILIIVQNRIVQQFMLRLVDSCVNVYNRYEMLPIVLVFVVKKKIVEKANAPYILKTRCEHEAKSARSIENYIQDSMDPFMALTQNLELMAFAADLKVFDQTMYKVQEVIELHDKDLILMLEKGKSFVKEFLEPIEG